MNLKLLQLNRLRISYFRIFVVPVVIVTNGFLICLGRPSADEYLLGPILNGFYIDSPNGTLFNPSSNLIIRYFQGTKAIVALGWDGLLNAATFQMFSSIALNYFGPAVSILLGLTYTAVLYWFAILISTKIFGIQKFKFTAAGIWILGLVVSLSVSDFNTDRTNFGLFPFTGIRFGLYAVHAWLYLALIYYLIGNKEEQQDSNKRFYVFVLLFCGMASLWFVMYWFATILVSAVIYAFTNSKTGSFISKKHVWTLTISAIGTLTFHNIFGGVLNRLDSSTSSDRNNMLNFFFDVILNHNSRLYSREIWNLSFGYQFWLGILIGSLISIFSQTCREVRSSNLRSLTKILAASLIYLPVIFVFQEYITYEAWWHRTSLIVISFTTATFIGLRVVDFLFPVNPKAVARSSIAIAVCATLITSSHVAKSFQAVKDFSHEWDSGDPFGTNSPIHNNEIYNYVNFLKLTPYHNASWKPPEIILETVQIRLSTISQDGLTTELLPGQITPNAVIQTMPSNLDSVLANELQVSFAVSWNRVNSNPNITPTLEIIDKFGPRNVEMSKQENQIITGYIAQPGTLEIKYLGTCQDSSLKQITEFCFSLTDINLHYSSQFRTLWGLIK